MSRQRPSDRQPTVLCVAPFNNPHIVPIYDALAECESLDVRRATLRRTPRARLEMGWPEMPDDTPYIQAWRSTREWVRYGQLLATADVAILPGVFHFRTLVFHHLCRRVLCKQTAFWSEPFLQHPRTLAQTKMWASLRRALLAPLNSKHVCLLAAGSGAEDDYRALGMHRWEFRAFSLAVEPCGTEPIPTGESRSTTRLVYCGAISARKGVDTLIDAVCRPEVCTTDFQLNLIGDGPLRNDLEEQCRARPELEGKVAFLGRLPREEARRELAEHDALVLPSRFDGWGAVVNEAMEAGLAVVVSDGVGARRPLVETGRNGLVFARGSCEQLVQSLLVLINSRDALEKMKTRSRETN